MPWYVLYTKPRNEKKVAEALEKIGINTYCPLVKVVKQWSDRKKKVLLPLISSYVFVKLEEKNRELVFQVPGVVRYLFWLGKPAIIREEEIETLQKWLATDYSKVSVQNLQPGSKIILNEGVFKGQTAVVKELRGHKVQVVLEALGVLVTMERMDH